MPLTRRLFIGRTLAASVLGTLPNRAEDAKPAPVRKIKLGLIGCGGRGMWLTNLFNKHGGYEFSRRRRLLPRRGRKGRRDAEGG